MIPNVKYTKKTYYIGRNGQGIQTGLALTHNGDVLSIAPINSKNHISNCVINIPYEDIRELRDMLRLAYEEKVW